MEVKEYCEKCLAYKNCKKPCRPIEQWLRDGSSLVFEDKRGDFTIVFSEYNHVKFCELPEEMGDQDKGSIFADPADQAEKVIPIKPKQFRAKIFYKRFFKQKPNKELAEELGISAHHCSAVYAEARTRLLKIVEALDGRDYGLKHVRKSKKNFSEPEKWFLLNKIFGFSVAEISRMPRTPKYDALKQRLRNMYDRYDQKLKAIS